jgi:tetratricopeptide (TPR) repeat protein
MAKRLNKSLVAMLTFVGFASAIGVSVLLIGQLKQQDPKHFIELAEQHKQRSDWKLAAQFYQEAYQISRDTQYLLDKGEMFLGDGDVQRAIASYKEAIANSAERSPERINAHTKGLELILTRARQRGTLPLWEETRRLSEDLLKEDGQNPLGLAAHGLALTKLVSQRPEYAAEGLAELKDACRLAPEKLQYVLDLLNRYIDLQREADLNGNEDQARSVTAEMQALIAESMTYFSLANAEAGRVTRADAARLRWEQGWHLAMQDRFDEADALFAESMSIGAQASDPKDRIAPQVQYANYLSARWANAEGHSASDPLFVQADELLRDGISKSPDDFDAYVQRAENLIAVRDYEEAIAVCEKRLELGFERRGLDAERQQDRFSMLLLLASRAAYSIAVHPANNQAERATQLARAEGYINRALGEFPDSPLITVQVGRIRLARGDDRGALELLNHADGQFQERGLLDWDTKLTLARLHLSLNAPGAAIKVLQSAESAAKATPSYFDYWTLYAQAYLDANQYERAMNLVADNVLRIEPDHQMAVRIRAKALTLLGRIDEAGAQAVNILGDQKSKLLVDAEKLRLEGDLPGMFAKLQDALSLDPTDVKLLDTTVRLLVGQGRQDDALEAVDRALTAKPDDKTIQRIRVSILPDLTIEQRNEQIKAIIESEEDEYLRVTQLAEFHYNRGELTDALPLLNRAEELLIDPTYFEATGRRAEKAMHRDVLTMKMLTAARLDDQQALADAADSATRHNVDGVNGSTFRGQYHMYREEATQAIVAFNEALTQQPDDVQALCYLGRCYDSLVPPRSADARACFDKAAELNPNSFLAHKGLAQIAFNAGDADQYRRHIGECRRIMTSENRDRGDAWVNARIQELNEEKNPREAIARREASLPDPPPGADDGDRFLAYQANLARLAQLHEKLNNWPEAEKYYRGVLSFAPDDLNRVLAVSGFLLRAQKPDDALAVLTGYRDARPTDADRATAMLPIAALHMELGRAEEAGRVLHQAADLSGSFDVLRALGEFYLRSGMPKEALPWLDQAVEKARAEASPRLASTMSARIGCLMHERMNDAEAARKRVGEYRAAFPEDPAGLYWQAELHARHGEIQLAVDALSRYLDKRPNVPFILYERARRYLALGKTPQAVQDLEALVRSHPDSPDMSPRILLAQIYQESGKASQARIVREAMVKQAPTSVEAVTELVKDYLDASALTEAENLLTSRINRDAANPRADWFFLRAHVAARMDDNSRAIADMKRGVELSGFDPARVASILDWFVELKMPAEGVTYYETHRDRFPLAATLLSRYALLLAKAQRLDDAMVQFRLAMGLALKEGFASIRTVHSALRMGFSMEDALERLSKLSVEDPALARVHDRLLLSVLISGGMTSEADAKIQNLLQTARSDEERAGLFAEQGMMYQMGGRFENACKAYEEALKYQPDHPLVLNNLAFILSDELKRHETAIPYAERAVELHPMPEVVDTLGWIHVRMGDCKQGIADLNRALRVNSNLPVIWYHLGDAYRRCGEFDVAVNVLNTGLRFARRTGDEELIADIDTARRRALKNDDTP